MLTSVKNFLNQHDTITAYAITAAAVVGTIVVTTKIDMHPEDYRNP